MDLRQFFRNNKYVSIPGKLSENHLHAWWFSNPFGKVLIIVGNRMESGSESALQLVYIYIYIFFLYFDHHMSLRADMLF